MAKASILHIFLSHDVLKAKLFHVSCFLQSTIFRLVLMTEVFQALQKRKSQKISALMKTYWSKHVGFLQNDLTI